MIKIALDVLKESKPLYPCYHISKKRMDGL